MIVFVSDINMIICCACIYVFVMESCYGLLFVGGRVLEEVYSTVEHTPGQLSPVCRLVHLITVVKSYESIRAHFRSRVNKQSIKTHTHARTRTHTHTHTHTHIYI